VKIRENSEDRLKLKRRALLGAAAAAGPVAVALKFSSTAEANDQVGAWGAPFNMGGVAIHATLMHTDEVLFFQYVEGLAGADHTSYVATWNWRTGVLREAPFTSARDVFCAGHNVLPDGRVFIAGGHDPNTGKKQDAIGVVECDIFDPVARTWFRTAPMTQKRWYPTNVGLPNGRVLILGGTASPGVSSTTIEEYNPATNTMRTLPSTANKSVGQYPRLHLLANGKVLMGGPPATSQLFDPATNRWASVSTMIYGKRSHGAVALLPGGMQIVTAGGGAPTRTAELLDMSQATPRWRSTGSLTYARMLSNTVVLPDGQVLIIGGGAAFKYTQPVKIPELYNPATGTWTAMAAHQASRMYHATALLLPDGRVLCAGQDNGSLARYGEIFSPPYLFRGARPTITNSPATVALGGQLQFTSPDAAALTRVVLIRPGSNTHEIDTNQRSVPLTFTVSGTTVTAQVPASVNLAPPGYYMLFALNGSGVPAVAPWVRLT
jgi:Galactose oxidase-like, Early set domain/Glyoxal oxidase N-terminus/Kelch motif